jgi:hypothetical protein
MQVCRTLLQRCCTLSVHHTCGAELVSSTQGCCSVVKVRQISDALSTFRGMSTNFVRKSVNGLWGRSGGFIIRESEEFSAPRSVILPGAKLCELNRIRVEIYQKCLETCDMINEMPKGFATCTHVAYAMGIPTSPPFFVFFTEDLFNRPRQESQPRQPPRLRRPQSRCWTNIRRALRFV